MDAFSTAGTLAALYDLGILHKVAPGIFEDDKGLDLRTAALAGLLGYGLGSHGKGEAEQHVASSEQRAQRMQEALQAAYAREQLLRQVIAQKEVNDRLLAGLHAAQLASKG